MSHALWLNTYLPPIFLDDNLKAKMPMFELWLDAKAFETMSNISVYKRA